MTDIHNENEADLVGEVVSSFIPFQVDQGIVQHLVFNQGSNAEKALLELVMNSIDANASKVDIFIGVNGFSCKDNGDGFKTADDIKRCFETFGTPHEDGDAKYGRFRLGRGQIMSFAETKWQTNSWQMDVDVKKGMGFSLSTLSTPVSGCHIFGRWYKRLDRWSAEYIANNIKSELRYIPSEITINGEAVYSKKSGEEWTFEDDDAYYRVDKNVSSFSVYNMGVFVMHQSLSGLGGVIVSKKALGLNTSRTAIMADHCDVWSRIKDVVFGLSKDIKHPWTRERKREAFLKIMSGHPDALDLIRDAPLISVVGSSNAFSIGTLLFGGSYSIKQRKPKYSGYTLPLEAEIPVAEMVANVFPKIAVIHPSVLGLMDASGRLDRLESEGIFKARMQEIHDFIMSNAKLYCDVCTKGGYYNLPIFSRMHAEGGAKNSWSVFSGVSFNSLADKVDMSCRTVKASEALKGEALRVWGAFKRPLRQYANLMRDGDISILVGESQTAEAWTDGETYIAFSTRIINSLSRSPLNEASRIFHILEHELMHCVVGCGSSSTGVEHDLAFYKGFHDQVMSNFKARQVYIRRALKSYRSGLRNRKAATLKAIENRKNIEAGLKPIKWFGWEKRRAPQLPELIDADAMMNYDILIMRMAMVRDYDDPIDRSEIDAPDDMISILADHIRVNKTHGKIDIDKAVSEAASRFGSSRTNDKGDVIKAISVSIASVASKMYDQKIFALIRSMALTNPKVFQIYKKGFWEFSWNRFLEDENVGDNPTIRDQVNLPLSPFRNKSEVINVFRRIFGEHSFRSQCSSRAGSDFILIINPALGRYHRVIVRIAESMFDKYHGTMPPLPEIEMQARRVINCIDFRADVMASIEARIQMDEQEDLRLRFFEDMERKAEKDGSNDISDGALSMLDEISWRR